MVNECKCDDEKVVKNLSDLSGFNTIRLINVKISGGYSCQFSCICPKDKMSQNMLSGFFSYICDIINEIDSWICQ